MEFRTLKHLPCTVRNCLGSWKTLLDTNDEEIQWQFIVKLYEFQKKNGFTFANKLSKQHVHFQKNQMKVKYAVQVLSQSVANALMTMCELKHPDFTNVEPTVKYLKIFIIIINLQPLVITSLDFLQWYWRKKKTFTIAC